MSKPKIPCCDSSEDILYLNVGKLPWRSPSLETGAGAQEHAVQSRDGELLKETGGAASWLNLEELWQVLSLGNWSNAAEFQCASAYQTKGHLRPKHAWPQSTGEDSVGMGWKETVWQNLRERVQREVREGLGQNRIFLFFLREENSYLHVDKNNSREKKCGNAATEPKPLQQWKWQVLEALWSN